MNRIWKYSFEINDEGQPFDWYANGAVDTVVAMQEDKLCLWQTALGDEKPYRYVAKVVGTGHVFDETWKHVGTGFDPYGFVWHLLIRPAHP
jgi:hypothetical protein